MRKNSGKELDAEEEGEIAEDCGSTLPQQKAASSSEKIAFNSKLKHPASASAALLSRTLLARRNSPNDEQDDKRRASSRGPRERKHQSSRGRSPPSSKTRPTLAANSAVESVNVIPNIDDNFRLSFERDEDEEAERLLEERRRRRREIMMMYKNQTDTKDSTITDSGREYSEDTTSQGKQSSGVAQSFALEKTGDTSSNVADGNVGSKVDFQKHTAMDPDADVSAADYNPNADSNADDMRHRILAKAVPGNDAEESNNMSSNDNAQQSSTKLENHQDESDDDFDMFADDNNTGFGKVTTEKAIASGAVKAGVGTAPISAPAMADSSDDSEGYYRIIVGELLDDRYLVQAFLGQGVFSSVVKALDTKNNNATVAIKIIRQNELMHKAGLKEQRILERIAAADPNDKMHVVRLLGSFMHRGHLCLCFELMSLNLREVVRKYGRDSGLNLQAVRVYAMHLFLALDLLRRCGILHGDLKPDNCFVSEQRNNVKLGDLGSACDASENEITPYLVSRFYRAPEIILGIPYDCAIDMWSLGATLFELFTGKILFPGRNNNHMLRLVMEARGHFSNRMIRRGQFWQQHFEDNGGSAIEFVSRSTDKLTGEEVEQRMAFTKPTNEIKARILQATPAGSSPEEIQLSLQFANLLSRCLELSPEKRITPIDALRHAFFAQR
ncbi:U4/U6 small nuclear ribonucleoprotein prp4 [Coemansia sp. RSA 1358]|nr:U4/U6 small nuclear ribonucleoprotein prp4 [Coemansia sp. RSA 1358]